MRAVALLLGAWLGLAAAASVAPEPQDEHSIHERDEIDEAESPESKSYFHQDLSARAHPHPKLPGKHIALILERKCDSAKKQKIEDAWKEAKQLADAQTSHVARINYDYVHKQWLGKDWFSLGNIPEGKQNFRKIIGDNFANLRKVFSDTPPEREYIYMYCYDYEKECGPFDVAYTWGGKNSNAHYIAFCDKFYESYSLDFQVIQHQNNKASQSVIDNFADNRGETMLHEVYHMSPLVGNPKIGDRAYDPQECFDNATQKGTEWAHLNAASYTLDAIAIYIQLKFNLAKPPVPGRPADGGRKRDAQKPRPRYLGSGGPKGWKEPKSGEPDLSYWEELQIAADGTVSEPPNSKPKPKPKPKPKAPALTGLGKQSCDKRAATDQHPLTQEANVVKYTGEACAGSQLRFIKKGDKPITYRAGSHPTYEYTISWVDGCDQKEKSVNVNKPLSDNIVTCSSLMQRNYKNCKNGGVGGSITAGCVKYEFRATK